MRACAPPCHRALLVAKLRVVELVPTHADHTPQSLPCLSACRSATVCKAVQEKRSSQPPWASIHRYHVYYTLHDEDSIPFISITYSVDYG